MLRLKGRTRDEEEELQQLLRRGLIGQKKVLTTSNQNQVELKGSNRSILSPHHFTHNPQLLSPWRHLHLHL